MNRQDVNKIVDSLLSISQDEYTVEDSRAIDRAVSTIWKLCDLVRDQQKDIQCLKQEILQLEAMIDD